MAEWIAYNGAIGEAGFSSNVEGDGLCNHQ